MKTNYKQTELGLIPIDWEVKKIEDVLNIYPTASYSRAEQIEDGEIQYLHYGDIHTKYNFHLKIDNENLPRISLEKLKNYKTIEVGDLIMADASEDYEGVGKSVEIIELSDKKAIAGLHTFLLRDKNKNFSLGYKGYMTTSDVVKKQFHRIAVGTKVYSLSKSSLQNLKIPLPPLPEQKAIAACLSTWDKAIHNYTLLINSLTLRKKALMQQLLTGKKRLPGFSGKIEYERLHNLLVEKSERNKDLKVTKVLSVTNSQGFINQSEQFGREVASADLSNYKIVRKNQFAYNPSRVNVGSLDLLRNFDEGLLSPMYVVFETKKNKLLSEFLFYHLKTWWFIGHIPQYVQGSVRDSLSFDGLKAMSFFIPTLQEQTAIAQVLAAADKEINLQQEKLELLQQQKKGLMQVLLTGKIRLDHDSFDFCD